jgi:putative phosphoesterase
MKIGIISDIHAYLEYLQAALNLLDALSVEHIICAGDIVDGGEHGDAVVRLLQEKDIPCVQGNHDRDAFADQSSLRRRMRITGEEVHPYLLESSTVGYVTALPLTRRFEWLNLSITIAHGTPESNTTYLFSESPDERFLNVINQVDSDVLILGHTHEPSAAIVNDRWIFNPGSVCLNRFDDTRTCAVLTLPNIRFEVFNIETGVNHPIKTKRINSK